MIFKMLAGLPIKVDREERPDRRAIKSLANVTKYTATLHGGGGTKFPQAPVLTLLLTDYSLNGTAESLQAVAETLNAMAFGGIQDHLGGGIHRYSTEPTWSVPHFEKMLYDNAQLIGLYADYYAITRQPLARDTTVDLAGYLAGRMTAPDGGFYTAEDADIEGKEGESYLWTRAEITDVLGSAKAERFFGLYELTPLQDEPKGPGVLRIRRDQIASEENRANLQGRVAELAQLRDKLLEVRDQRRQPLRDDKIVVALNGLARRHTGLARCSRRSKVLNGRLPLLRCLARLGQANDVRR